MSAAQDAPDVRRSHVPRPHHGLAIVAAFLAALAAAIALLGPTAAE